MGRYIEVSRKLNRPGATSQAPVRLIVKYKDEFQTGYKGNMKSYVPFQLKTDRSFDVDGLIKNVCDKNKGKYTWAWLLPNNVYTYADVIRAWIENGIELSEQELKKLNERRFFKYQNKQNVR